MEVYVLFCEEGDNLTFCGEEMLGIFASFKAAEKGAKEYCIEHEIELKEFKITNQGYWAMEIENRNWHYDNLIIKIDYVRE
jgi:hypothetical protein